MNESSVGLRLTDDGPSGTAGVDVAVARGVWWGEATAHQRVEDTVTAVGHQGRVSLQLLPLSHHCNRPRVVYSKQPKLGLTQESVVLLVRMR